MIFKRILFVIQSTSNYTGKNKVSGTILREGGNESWTIGIPMIKRGITFIYESSRDYDVDKFSQSWTGLI